MTFSFQYFSEIAQNPESNLAASTCTSSASSSVSASPYLGRSANNQDSPAPHADHVYAVPALVRQSEQVLCRTADQSCGTN